jgi:transcription elongation factor Elf1
MDEKKCPALVDGKECDLGLILVERELETEVETYECPRGHRTEFLIAEIVKRKCGAYVDGKECGLPVALVQRELETATEVYECPLDHRTYVPLEPEA